MVFLNAMECLTRGWFLHHVKDITAPSPAELIRIQQGEEIHRRARARFPDGIYVSEVNAERALKRTRDLMGQTSNRVLFEPYFRHEGCVTRADIVTGSDSVWLLEEVKSNTSLKPDLIDDLGYTTMVMLGSRINISDVTLTVVNKDYRNGDDETQFLTTINVKEEVFSRAAQFEARRREIEDVIASPSCPESTLIWPCRSCDFFVDQCVGKTIKVPVFEVPRLSKTKFEALVELGVTEISGIPSDFKLSNRQRRVVDAVQSGELWVSDQIATILNLWKWPLFYLDFETVSSCLPLYEGLAPYAQIPTQYSLHIRRNNNSTPEHREFLADPEKDCRRELAESLITDLEGIGNIVVYSPFEKTTLSRMQESFEDLAEPLERAKERLVDLMAVLTDHVWHPDFAGSASIKHTLPVLVPDMDYSDLEIANGDHASAAFYNMATGKLGPADIQDTRAALLAYCKRDTFAMLKLHDAIADISG